MAHIFISYSSEDGDFARYLQALLIDKGFTVWLDQKRLEAGDDWWDKIELGIKSCKAFAVIMSPHSRKSNWVRREILLAEKENKTIFPILYQGELFPFLAELQFVNMQQGLSAQLPNEFIARLQRLFADQTSKPSITFTIENDNIVNTQADVLILKFAQAFHGADYFIAEMLMTRDINIDRDKLREQDGNLLLSTQNVIMPKNVFFVATPSLANFNYKEVREFAHNSLRLLAIAAPETETIAMTMHGVNFGLDIRESVLAQFGGILDALKANEYPPNLKHIRIVEIDEQSYQELLLTMTPYLDEAEYINRVDGKAWAYEITISSSITNKNDGNDAGIESHRKPFVYAVVPSEAGYEDIYYYGVQKPAHANGLLCERCLLNEMTMENLKQLSQRLSTTKLAIFDVSMMNEYGSILLGIALGTQTPILILQPESVAENPILADAETIVTYDKIWQLEERLSQVFKGFTI